MMSPGRVSVGLPSTREALQLPNFNELIYVEIYSRTNNTRYLDDYGLNTWAALVLVLVVLQILCVSSFVV